jgi:hypothetical protein
VTLSRTGSPQITEDRQDWGERRVASGGAAVAGALFCLAAAALAVGKSLDRGLNHDEHQFVAPALFFLREGWLPYRDFPLFHMPDLVFLYAGAAALFENGFLGIRLSCGLAAGLTLWMLYAAVARSGGGGGRAAWKFVAAGGIGLLLLLGSPVFVIASGLSWNHDWPAFFTVAAVLSAAVACQSEMAVGWVALAGLFAGLAAGSRLTFVFLIPPVVAAPFFFPGQTGRRRLALVAWGLAGVGVSMLPALWLFARAPDAFLFGNLQYPRLPLLDPANEQHIKAMAPWRKVRFFFKEFAGPNAVLFGAFLLVGLPGCLRLAKERAIGGSLARMTLLALPFLFFGCFIPSRYQGQHFYAPAPLLALATGLALARVERRRLWAVGIAAALSLGICARDDLSRALIQLGTPGDWCAVKLGETAAKIREQVGEGRVATLAPLIPLIAGVKVPPQFATGPFGWRNAHLVDRSRREKFHLAGPSDVDALFENEKVKGVLVGYESERLEQALRDAAERRGFRAVDLGRERVLLVAGGTGEGHR